MTRFIFVNKNKLKDMESTAKIKRKIIPEKTTWKCSAWNIGNFLTISTQHMLHACNTCCLLTFRTLPTFQARHFQVFLGMIVALILTVDPKFFKSFCSQKTLSFGYLRNFYVTTLLLCVCVFVYTKICLHMTLHLIINMNNNDIQALMHIKWSRIIF
jgi:hypothetical protein